MATLSLVWLLCTLLLSFCVGSSRFFVSNQFALEPQFPHIDSERIVHAVTGNVDENNLLDAIVFYATSVDMSKSKDFREQDYEHSITFHHMVIYDIRSGPRIWQGPHGFYPFKSTGYSEPQPSFTMEHDVNTRSCYGSGTHNRYYRDWPEAQAFVAIDLNDNGKLDVVVVSATGYCHKDHCEPPRTLVGEILRRRCTNARHRGHINIKTWLLMDIQPDGRFSKVVEGSSFVSNTTSIGARSLRVGVSASVEQHSACSNSHLLTVIQGQTRAQLCLDLDGNVSPSHSLPLLQLVNMHDVNYYSTSTALKMNGDWWYLLVNRGGEWMLWLDSHNWYNGNFNIPNSASIAVAAVDFDDDGVDDVILIDCPSTRNRCRLWHGTFYSSEFNDYDVHNDDFFNELL
ncbi:hypothetical protein P9112_010838 [Eukaryota sp. TZLM1-RC]